MKVNKHGVVFGKFMPLHKGHEYLIETAISECEQVSIIVCSLSHEPIDGNLRYSWVQNRFGNIDGVNVFHIKEDWIPQEPSECFSHSVFYGTWSGVIKALVGSDIDALFASEDYVYPMASHLSCKSVLVDMDRKTFNVSGTKVRENPYGYWDFINDDVKDYYRKRILIIGSESTGKSTLTKRLADHYNEKFQSQNMAIGIQEYAREWIDECISGDMDKLSYHDIRYFGGMQNHLARTACEPIVISDTDAIVSSVFQIEYFGMLSQTLHEEMKRERNMWDLVLFLQPDCEWVDDGQRNLSHKRDEMTRNIKGWLEKLGINYIPVFGSWESRFKKSVEYIDKCLNK